MVLHAATVPSYTASTNTTKNGTCDISRSLCMRVAHAYVPHNSDADRGYVPPDAVDTSADVAVCNSEISRWLLAKISMWFLPVFALDGDRHA